MIICENCGKDADENEIFCCYCSYNLQESLENMQQSRVEYKSEKKNNWFNKILTNKGV
ncbi:hypothetical protein [Clostridium estertheticum]|uniref:hypothetical protein n=1 Tax=Clostridium estertheticum TaxID=238834 RepID=UPI000B2E1ED5|nr:hypothetical protein [Clostridium estertheticum]MBU3072885.1 hypothetical protein [Clostridium estertheticum]MBU3163078.1 hypothetical protein [Clostridium estertheticum]MBU3172683.1 hypothetical protein [Clostridium estertheticum]MBZ9616670.1 hypothetical protein [Clostridium estertheticum subsp. laramiense]WAG72386.1 hypothetical protein LL032_14600 [Clostridium estertheticum]